jgi:casein kinase 1
MANAKIPYYSLIMEIKVANKFKVGRKLGHGSFGDIYHGQNLKTGEEVAIKLEKIRTRNPKLIPEARILKSIQGGVGIPTLHWFGAEGDFSIMVLELLGASLEDLLRHLSYSMSLKTVLTLAEQMLARIEYLHSKDLIHRDIKPENFLIGRDSHCDLVYLIDFGLAKRFRDPKTGTHIEFCEGKSLTGTARYASIFTHRGMQQSRRDDLECLGYVLVYLLKGSLPWQGLQGNTQREKYLNITQTKIGTSLDVLCAELPFEFKSFLMMARALKFDERPDYALYIRMFSELNQKMECLAHRRFDWSHLNGLDGTACRTRSPNRSIEYCVRNSSNHRSEENKQHDESEHWVPMLNLVLIDNK